ncbi:protein artemis-like [Paramacrobiotus metropolitanus]|uniref:protein artemis-like n=1 Tax=Paramacrobiotus metropolitanus TaxID=2943436 RepID=UPI0024456BA2|nr:protein artemis-like [Paramacrobiotus metropolitanus]
MDAFDGFVKEYTGISVDKFVERNFRSVAFFLSHCHLDHMAGLATESFENFLKRSANVSIYCSEVTAELLRSNSRLAPSRTVLSRLISLPEYFPSNINILNGDKKGTVSVTLIPAGHCLGSVMFLFDGDKGKVLYTGDFRYYADQIEKCEVLLSLSGTLTALYLDTTFCDPYSRTFPKREQCIRGAVRQIKEWTLNTNAVICLDCRMEYGYEPFFVALHQELGEKIHVSSKKYSLYRGLPEILDALTLDGDSTRLHLCAPGKCIRTQRKTDRELCTIKLCAQTFVVRKRCGQLYIANSRLSYSYCYSMHSSLDEIQKFVDFLKPDSIVPCAVPHSATVHTILGYLKTSDITEAEPVNIPKIPFQGPTFSLNDGSKNADIERKDCIEEEMLSFEDEVVLPRRKRMKNS